MEPKIKEEYPKCYTDPRSSRLGSTTDQLERNNTKDKIFIKLLLELGCVTPGPIHKDSPSSRSGGGSTFNPRNSKIAI